MAQQGSAARHTFYYLLVLVTLGFTAVGLGQIIFQIINNIFPETTFAYNSSYSQDILRFGMSSVIVASPIYWLVTRAINKELAKGWLDQHSRVRKWLTYLILFAASVTVIGFLMGILNSFLSGELTIKFILKALTAIIIAGLVFLYYFYDIRRDKFEINQTIIAFRVTFLAIVIVSVVAGFFFIDSPAKARAVREDNERVSRLRNLNYEITDHYQQNDELPASITDIQFGIQKSTLRDPASEEEFEYEVLGPKNYKLCAEFAYSNLEEEERSNRYYNDPEWLHDTGNYCFENEITEQDESERLIPRRVE